MSKTRFEWDNTQAAKNLKPIDPDDYELRDEYDFSKMAVVPKGKRASRIKLRTKASTRLVPDTPA